MRRGARARRTLLLELRRPGGQLPPLETVPAPSCTRASRSAGSGCLRASSSSVSPSPRSEPPIGLFATGSWAWGIVLLLLAVVLLAALGEATRRSADAWVQHSSRLAADGRAHAATTAEVWRTRLDTTLSRWRTRSRLDEISHERGPALQALGDAVWRDDAAAERDARQRLADLEQEEKRVEEELAVRLAGADERIRKARLPVQETLMVAPNELEAPAAKPPPPGRKTRGPARRIRLRTRATRRSPRRFPSRIRLPTRGRRRSRRPTRARPRASDVGQ